MRTLAMLQNPSAKLTDVDPSVAQHYHDKLLEARREKAHVRRSHSLLFALFIRSSGRRYAKTSCKPYSYSQKLKLKLAMSDCGCVKYLSRRCCRRLQESHDHARLLTNIFAIAPTHFLLYMPAHPLLFCVG